MRNMLLYIKITKAENFLSRGALAETAPVTQFDRDSRYVTFQSNLIYFIIRGKFLKMNIITEHFFGF